MAQKIRVYKLAREFGIANEIMVNSIQGMGIEVSNYMSAMDIEVAQRVRHFIHKQQAENTVEEHIRPTVVRRRTRNGAPVKPIRKKPAKVEAAENEIPKPRVAKKAPMEVASPKEKEPIPAPMEVQEAPMTVEPPVEEEPIAVQELSPAETEPQVETVEEAEEVEAVGDEDDKDKHAGVEVAAGPAVLRPSAEAPLVRRRIPVSPGRGPAKGASSPSPRNRAKIEEIQMPVQPQTPPPGPGEGRQVTRRGRTPQRRREVESRDITPQGRFSGVGPSRFGGASPPGRKRRMAPGKKGKKTEITTPKASKRVIRIEDQISLQDLAKRMGVKATELLMQLMGMGVGTININSTLDLDTAKIVASDFDYEIENVAMVEKDLLASTRGDESDEEKKDREMRPPVVTMMGHVDHGKTSLLDKLRKSDIVSSEAGGITQHIGAYRVKTPTGTLTFIDTPGHEAFTAMRSRGATTTDIVILVVAADDGVMPQTIEAINHANAAGVPIIVAINKCDLPGTDTGRCRRMLMEHSLVPEELGGETIMLEVSAKTGEGLDKLVEMIMLQAEVLELTANPKRQASGVVLEAYLDRGRGPVANVLVQEGTLNTGEVLVAGAAFGKIRAMTDEQGRKVKAATPSTPVEVLGLASVPEAGDQFDVAANMKIAEKVGKTRADKNRAAGGAAKPSLESLHELMQADKQAELKVIIKSDVQGTMEALKESLESLTGEKVKVIVVHSSVGGITESDVLLASTAGAIIIGFNVRPAGKARSVSEQQGVEIKLFSVIYDVVDSVKLAMVGLLEPEIREEVLGQVEVRDTFTIPKVGTIAGSYVLEGKVIRNARARLIRDSVLVWEGKLSSLRRFKDDVKEVASGFECGISLEGYNDVKMQDIIEIYVEKEVAASLS